MPSYSEIVTEVLTEEFAPVLENLGLKRFKPLRWRKNERLEVRALVDSKAHDPFRGSAFTLEFEISLDGTFEKKLAGRARLRQLLAAVDRSAFLDMQNAIARGLERPPASYLESLPGSLHSEYLKAFEPASDLESDIWMRFRSAEDVRNWSHVLIHIMPTLIERAETLRTNVMYLGKDMDW